MLSERLSCRNKKSTTVVTRLILKPQLESYFSHRALYHDQIVLIREKTRLSSEGRLEMR